MLCVSAVSMQDWCPLQLFAKCASWTSSHCLTLDLAQTNGVVPGQAWLVKLVSLVKIATQAESRQLKLTWLADESSMTFFDECHWLLSAVPAPDVLSCRGTDFETCTHTIQGCKS